MDGDGEPVSESKGQAGDGSKAFLPIGIVFLVVAIGMIFSGTASWIAFFTIGITFLILGTQKPSTRDESPPGRTTKD